MYTNNQHRTQHACSRAYIIKFNSWLSWSARMDGTHSGFSCMAQVCNYRPLAYGKSIRYVEHTRESAKRTFGTCAFGSIFPLEVKWPGKSNRYISPPMSTRSTFKTSRINPLPNRIHSSTPRKSTRKQTYFIHYSYVRAESACTGFDTHTRHAVCFGNVFAFGRRNMQIPKVI